MLFNSGVAGGVVPKFGVGATPKPDGFELMPSDGNVGLGARPGMVVLPPKLLELPKPAFPFKVELPPMLGALPNVL